MIIVIWKQFPAPNGPFFTAYETAIDAIPLGDISGIIDAGEVLPEGVTAQVLWIVKEGHGFAPELVAISG
jgi:hypothetical protein